MSVITVKQMQFICGQILEATKEEGADEPCFAESSDTSRICVVDQANGDVYDVTIKARKL